jgi:DNA-binding NarL/FixJ family response regulator
MPDDPTPGTGNPTATKVLIASDRPLFRRALAEALESRGMEVAGEANEEPEAIALSRERKPDVLIVDLETGATRLPWAIDEVREVSPRTEVVVVTRFDNPAQARAMLEDGAHAYLGRGATMEELLLAVRSVQDPGRKGVAMMIVSKRAASLTDREIEILVEAARGLTNGEIASRLYVEEATVRRHLANVYKKMGVGSRGEATRKALEEGWITVRDILGKGRERGDEG